jgi:predicted nucleic acid-binding protein
MAFVLDASITMSWAFTDEADDAALKALHRLQTEAACVPSVWWFEIRNVLLVSERRRRISEADAAAFLRFVAGLAIAIDHAPDDTVIIALARQCRLTIYDASYLELALRNAIPLATLDRQLATAAQQAGVTLIA